MNGVEFRLLDPVPGLVLSVNGRPCPLGPPKEQCLLAVLLLSPGKALSKDHIITCVWGERPPAKARVNLDCRISRIRRTLRNAVGDRVRLLSKGGTCTIEVDPECIDLTRFDRLREKASAAAVGGDMERAIELLEAAEGLWAGEPLVGLPGDWAERTARRLSDALVDAKTARIGLELRLGRFAKVLDETRRLSARHPVNEVLSAHLMTALHGSGLRMDALNEYQRIRRRLREDLGLEPGSALQELHQRILRSGGAGTSPAGRPGTRPPDTLLGDTPHFVGRENELQMVGLIRAERPSPGVVVIEGMPGAGKTALAVRAAHMLAPYHPDARLYLNLRTHDVTRPPLDVATALFDLLEMLGVPRAQIPETAEERAVRWRAELDRRRSIVILDDAPDLDDIRLLLPKAPCGLVLVTTRRRAALRQGIRRIPLGVLPDEHAAALCARLGVASTEIDGIVRETGGLPLALMNVARPARPVDPRNPGATATIAEAFAGSCRWLTGDQRVALHRLCLFPAHDMTMEIAQLLLDGLPDGVSVIDVLARHHLIEQDGKGRYRIHPLLRDHARGQADSGGEDRRTVARLLDHYVQTLKNADGAVYPHRWKMPLGGSPGNGKPLSKAAAEEWLAAEWRNVLELARYAEQHEWQDHCANLIHLIAEFLDNEQHREEALDAHRRAVRVCQSIGSHRGTARALLDLALTEVRVGAHDDAARHAREASKIFDAVGLRAERARSYVQIGLAFWARDEHDQALTWYGEAEALYQELGDDRERANALRFQAMAHWSICQYPRSYQLCDEALEIYHRIGDRLGEAKTLNNKGHIEQSLARHREADDLYQRSSELYKEVTGKEWHAILDHNRGDQHRHKRRFEAALGHYRRALAAYRDTRDRANEPDVLNGIGMTYLAMERPAEALKHFQQAKEMAEEIGCRSQRVRALVGIAGVRRESGEFGAAWEIYCQALELARAIRDRRQEAEIHEGIAIMHDRQRHLDGARRSWRTAYHLYDEIGLTEPRDRAKMQLQLCSGSSGFDW
jgi:DNA-binding SARP family transcriptional activator/tetratricopeptide (TPR) repeat protein